MLQEPRESAAPSEVQQGKPVRAECRGAAGPRVCLKRMQRCTVCSFWAPRSLLWPPSQYYPKQSRTALPAGSALQRAPSAATLPGPSHRSRNPPAAGGRSTSSHGTSAREMTGRKSSGSRAWAKRRCHTLELRAPELPQKTAIITAPLCPLTHCTTQLGVAGEIHLGKTQIKC